MCLNSPLFLPFLQICDGLKMEEVDAATGLAVERELGVADLVKIVEELSLIH